MCLFVPEDLVPYWAHMVGAARRCQAVYRQKHLIPGDDAFADFDHVEVFLSNQTLATVAHDEKRIVFTARGTDPGNRRAVRNDINAVLSEEWGMGRVHLGGRTELDHIWLRANHYVDDILASNPERRIYCEGHSLGGLIAELFYARRGLHAVRSCLKYLPYGLVTFGKPHGGDLKYKMWVEFISDLHRMRQDYEAFGHARFINGCDLITRVPANVLPQWLPLIGRMDDYVPSGVDFRFFADGSCRREPWPWRTFTHWLKARFSRHPFVANMLEHKMENYVAKIEGLQIEGSM